MFDLSIAPKALQRLVRKYLTLHTLLNVVGWTHSDLDRAVHVWFTDGGYVAWSYTEICKEEASQ
jgi:hypothetical protein